MSRTKVSPVVEGNPKNPQRPMWTGPSWRSIVAQQRGMSADKWWVRCSAGPRSVDSPNNGIININNNDNGTIHSAASTTHAGSAHDDAGADTAPAVTMTSTKSGKARPLRLPSLGTPRRSIHGYWSPRGIARVAAASIATGPHATDTTAQATTASSHVGSNAAAAKAATNNTLGAVTTKQVRCSAGPERVDTTATVKAHGSNTAAATEHK